MTKYIKIVNFIIIISVIFTSCATFPFMGKAPISSYIADAGVKRPKELTKFFMANNPKANKKEVSRLAQYYVAEGAYEGINSDIAFVQMCLETGFLTYGGLVTEDMNNFCGLGAIDKNNTGERFPSPQLGVRAHIQHLHAYGTTEPLKGTLIDMRYKYVQPKGKSPTIAGLSGTWAADRAYGDKLQRLLNKLEKY